MTDVPRLPEVADPFIRICEHMRHDMCKHPEVLKEYGKAVLCPRLRDVEANCLPDRIRGRWTNGYTRKR
jgi:hypothetical protein